MAFAGILLFIFIVSYITASKAYVTVQCKNETTVQYGQKSLLECVVTTKQEATDLQIRVVTWKKEGVEDALLVFNKGKTKPLPGYSFAEPSWNDRNMNALLITNNAALQDEGVYTCVVMTYMGSASNCTSLKVTAKYNVPTINSIPKTITLNQDSMLVCTSDGGYPEGKLRWFDQDGMEWTKSAGMEVKQTENGLFHLTSRLTLLRGSIFSKYICVVFNANGGKEDEATFGIPDPPTTEEVPHDPATKQSPFLAFIIITSCAINMLITMIFIVLITRRGSSPSDSEASSSSSQLCNTDATSPVAVYSLAISQASQMMTERKLQCF